MAHISAPTTVVAVFGVVAAYLASVITRVLVKNIQYPWLISLPPPQLLLVTMFGVVEAYLTSAMTRAKLYIVSIHDSYLCPHHSCCCVWCGGCLPGISRTSAVHHCGGLRRNRYILYCILYK